MFPFVAAAIRRLNEAGLPVIVVTNQSGVGRGYFPESLVHAVNELMTQQLAEKGAKIDAVYYCPHTSAENCSCRKPRTGMLGPRSAGTHSRFAALFRGWRSVWRHRTRAKCPCAKRPCAYRLR